MADYAIGDVQGCYNALQRLLEHIDFSERHDRLWFVGDLVNRGPDSLAVLRYIRQLPIKPCITLGNHDLYLLSHLFSQPKHSSPDDTLHPILIAPDREELGHWLRNQSILIHDPGLNIVMSHAGIPPNFNLADAKARALELEIALSGEQYLDFLKHMYGNEPSAWHDSLSGVERLRFICNAFTRMRMCTGNGRLSLAHKSTLEKAPSALYPWFAVPNRQPIEADIIFGHWAALKGQCDVPHIYAIDTGCFWGGPLTALRIQDKQRFEVKAGI